MQSLDLQVSGIWAALENVAKQSVAEKAPVAVAATSMKADLALPAVAKKALAAVVGTRAIVELALLVVAKNKNKFLQWIF